MSSDPIKVVVVEYHDRKNLVMRYVDPVAGKQVCRSTGTTHRRDAERIAAKWEAELREGRYQVPCKGTWEAFRDRYEDEKLASLSRNSQEAANSAFNHFEKIINPAKMTAVNATTLSRFQAELRKLGLEETSIATHLRHLRAAFGWAVKMKLLTKVPTIEMPQRARGKSLMRGRPITAEEFERMLAVVPSLRPLDAPVWIRYLNGLWLSGLRLEESTVVTWEDEGLISVDLSGRHPRLRIYAEAEKGHQDRLLPLTPDLAEFLLATPVHQRHGLVFKVTALPTGKSMTPKRIGRIVSAIGKAANVMVNKAEEKYASAHDLRRSFGTRWANRVKPATLQLLMRHKSIETTLKYYVEQDADDVADELYRGFAAKNPEKTAILEADAAVR